MKSTAMYSIQITVYAYKNGCSLQYTIQYITQVQCHQLSETVTNNQRISLAKEAWQVQKNGTRCSDHVQMLDAHAVAVVGN